MQDILYFGTKNYEYLANRRKIWQAGKFDSAVWKMKEINSKKVVKSKDWILTQNLRKYISK